MLLVLSVLLFLYVVKSLRLLYGLRRCVGSVLLAAPFLLALLAVFKYVFLLRVLLAHDETSMQQSHWIKYNRLRHVHAFLVRCHVLCVLPCSVCRLWLPYQMPYHIGHVNDVNNWLSIRYSFIIESY